MRGFFPHWGCFCFYTVGTIKGGSDPCKWPPDHSYGPFNNFPGSFCLFTHHESSMFVKLLGVGCFRRNYYKISSSNPLLNMSSLFFFLYHALTIGWVECRKKIPLNLPNPTWSDPASYGNVAPNISRPLKVTSEIDLQVHESHKTAVQLNFSFGITLAVFTLMNKKKTKRLHHMISETIDN